MEEIKRAYRSLAKKLHPDLNKNNTKAEEQLKKVNEAYAVLKDMAKRAEYDYLGRQAQEAEIQNKKSAEKTTEIYTAPGPTNVQTSQEPAGKKGVRYYLYFFINKMILLAILVAYGWVFYINIDKHEPYNVFKTLSNTADYLIDKITDKSKEGIVWSKKQYVGSYLQEKLTFYLVKNGKLEIIKKYPEILSTRAFDRANNMYSVLMSAPNAEMTEYLLSLPHDVSYKAKDGATALLAAIKRNDKDSVLLLLQDGASVRDLPDKNWDKYTDDKNIIYLLNKYFSRQAPKVKIKTWNKQADDKQKSP